MLRGRRSKAEGKKKKYVMLRGRKRSSIEREQKK
jgi:hypothetical protein